MSAHIGKTDLESVVRWLKKIGAFLAVMLLLLVMEPWGNDGPTGFAIVALALCAASGVGRIKRPSSSGVRR